MPKFAVIGPGTMGCSIAFWLAAHGDPVKLFGRNEASFKKVEAGLKKHAEDLESSGLASQYYPGWRDRIEIVSMRDDGLHPIQGSDVVFEAIQESASAKSDLLSSVEKLVAKEAILASSTSGIAVNEIALGCEHKDRIVVTHFANPPHLMPTVEVVPGSGTTLSSIELISKILADRGKVPVRLNKDLPGHIFNRIQFAMLREAISLVETGVATPDQIDLLVKNGLALRLAQEGPLEKIDLAGLQLVHDVAVYLFPSLASNQTPAHLETLLSHGVLGAESGQGFYTWTPEKIETAIGRRNEEVIRHLKLIKKRTTS